MKRISFIKSNIRKYAKAKGITLAEVYKRTGITDGTFSNASSLSEDSLLKFLNEYIEVSPCWLLTGEGPMVRVYSDPATPGDLLSEPGGEEGSEVAQVRVPFIDMSDIGKEDNSCFPLEKVGGSTGYYVIPKLGSSRIDFMTEVSGSSIYHKYCRGDVVACTVIRNSTFLQWRRVHLIVTREQGVIIGRIDSSDISDGIRVVSEDGSCCSFDIPRSEVVGIAMVVGAMRFE